jgi:protein CsiD
MNISGFNISNHLSSTRIINIQIKDDVLEKLSEKFSRFDLTAIEYKPFTRFTIAKHLDDLSNNQLSKFLNEILHDRNSGCFVIGARKFKFKNR